MKMITAIVWGGMALGNLAACARPGPADQSRMAADDQDCTLCREQSRIDEEHRAGRISTLEWVDRRTALLEGEFFQNRLALLEERARVLESDDKAGGESSGKLLETKLQIARLKYALGQSDEKEWKAKREELGAAYRNWLKGQLDGGKMSQEEYKKRSAAVEEP